MQQNDLNRAVTRATGETVATVKRLGFLLPDPAEEFAGVNPDDESLADEFPEIEFDVERSAIMVVTDPVELEHHDFGAFRIELLLSEIVDGEPYRVVAVSPNPSSSNPSVTHPHVSDEKLCEGDGRKSIRSAPRTGRLLDFFVLVRQMATSVTVQFDDDSVADLFDELVDEGLTPAQFGRVWIHTHPGDSAEPSQVDEETFDRCFSGTDWAVMFILARGGETYARLRFHVGPGGSLRIPTQVDWSAPFGLSDHAGWDQEYAQCVHEPSPATAFGMSDLHAADWTRLADPFADYQPLFDQEIFRNDGLEP